MASAAVFHALASANLAQVMASIASASLSLALLSMAMRESFYLATLRERRFLSLKDFLASPWLWLPREKTAGEIGPSNIVSINNWRRR